MISKLIILRGNSGSGKTTTASKLQKVLGENTLLVSQDLIRRDMLKVPDREGNLSIELIKQIAEYGLGKCPFVIVEGILINKRYKNMLLELINIFEQNAYVYYFDIPFDETLIRHSNRAKVNEFGEKEMRSWWNEKDYLGVSNERIIIRKADKSALAYEKIGNLTLNEQRSAQWGKFIFFSLGQDLGARH